MMLVSWIVLVLLALAPALAHAQVVDDFSPRSGPRSGATLLSISGKAFANTGLIRLRFTTDNDRTEVPVTYVNPNTLIATTAHFNHTGEHDVAITFDGVSYSSFEGEFLVYANTFQDSFVPLSGPDSGGSVVTLFGSFVDTGEIVVLFDIFGEEYLYNDATFVDQYTLRVVTKRFPKAGKYDVAIALNGQQFDQFSEYYIAYDQDLLDSFTPTSGPKSGSTIMRILGAGFSDTGEHTVRFVDSAGKTHTVFADYVTATELTLRTPVFAQTGAHTVEVAQNGQDYETMSGAFSVY